MRTHSHRPQIWVAIRLLGRAGIDITVERVRGELVAPGPWVVDAIRDYLRDLAAAGVLEPIAPEIPGVFRLLRDEGAEAPRVRSDGTRVTAGQGREALWRTMRILTRAWSVPELAVHASTETHPVALQEANDYAKRLRRAGYLQRTAPGTYRLIPSRYTGPRPPQIRKSKAVWDPNLGAPPPAEWAWDAFGREGTR